MQTDKQAAVQAGKQPNILPDGRLTDAMKQTHRQASKEENRISSQTDNAQAYKYQTRQADIYKDIQKDKHRYDQTERQRTSKQPKFHHAVPSGVFRGSAIGVHGGLVVKILDCQS